MQIQCQQPKEPALPVNGPRIRQYRRALGLTQMDLANRSGYSERLVRKAESGGRLRPSTIADLAESLCEPGQTVTLQDLILPDGRDLSPLADLLMSPERSLDTPAADDVLQLVDGAGTQFHIAGLPGAAEFFGIWSGATGFRDLRQRLHAAFNEFVIDRSTVRRIRHDGQFAIFANGRVCLRDSSRCCRLWLAMQCPHVACFCVYIIVAPPEEFPTRPADGLC